MREEDRPDWILSIPGHISKTRPHPAPRPVSYHPPHTMHVLVRHAAFTRNAGPLPARHAHGGAHPRCAQGPWALDLPMPLAPSCPLRTCHERRRLVGPLPARQGTVAHTRRRHSQYTPNRTNQKEYTHYSIIYMHVGAYLSREASSGGARQEGGQASRASLNGCAWGRVGG